MKDFINTVLDKLNQTATLIPWIDVLEFLAVSGVLSLVLVPVYKYVKRYFEHNKGVMRTITVIAGAAIAFGQYIVETQPESPAVVAYKSLAYAFTSGAFYHVVKGVVAILAREIAKAQAFDNEVKSAKIPTVITDTPTVFPTTDFKH